MRQAVDALREAHPGAAEMRFEFREGRPDDARGRASGGPIDTEWEIEPETAPPAPGPSPRTSAGLDLRF
jgi:hypothetical protein